MRHPRAAWTSRTGRRSRSTAASSPATTTDARTVHGGDRHAVGQQRRDLVLGRPRRPPSRRRRAAPASAARARTPARTRPPATAPRPRARPPAPPPSARPAGPAPAPTTPPAGTAPPRARTTRAARPRSAPAASASVAPQRRPAVRGRAARATSSSARANTGNRPYSSRPMPIRCEPCPVNRNASLLLGGRRSGVQPRRAGRPPRARSGWHSACSRSSATKPARRGKAARVVASENATSAGSVPGSASRSSSRAAWSRSASGVRAETSHGATEGRGRLGSAPSCGASSMITCALVPLSPNDEMPARRGSSRARPRLRLRAAARPHRPTSPHATTERRRAMSSAAARGAAPAPS